MKPFFSDGCPLQVEDGHFLGGQCYSGNVILLMCLGKNNRYDKIKILNAKREANPCVSSQLYKYIYSYIPFFKINLQLL